MKGEKTGGRVAGTPNKATAELRELARTHTESAITELARLAVRAESEAARVAAIREILDRGYGKSTQVVGGDPENPLQQVIRWAAPQEAIADPSKKSLSPIALETSGSHSTDQTPASE